ncbi:MAG: MarR family winged helix-turn-helix transcriptional regulator [Propionicimonas sp.]
MSRDESYLLVDDALIRLRRLWTGTAQRPATSARRKPTVEMSTVLVVDAIHRLQVMALDGEVTVAAIADRLDVAASTASRIVDRAVTASMVARGASSVDPRRVALTLTPRGQKLLAEAGAFRRSFVAGVLDGWTEAEADAFAELLDRFATAVHRDPPTSLAAKATSTTRKGTRG